MAKEVVYRCHNTGGPDGDCEFAANDETIAASEVTIGEDGQAYCPGKTVFGDPCGAVLEEVIPPRKFPWLGISIGAMALVVVSVSVWFLLLRGSALLRVDQTALTFEPGQTTRIELFNDGVVGLDIERIEFSADSFTLESEVTDLELEPGDSEYIRIKLAQNVQDSVQGTMTIFSNSDSEPAIIKLVGNANPWNVADRLNSTSNILDKE